MKFISFGSGSSGNCYYLQDEDKGNAILIDAGVGIRKLKKYFREYDINAQTIQGILVTHDHADHIKSLGTLSNELGIPVYATALVHQGIQRLHGAFKKVAPTSIVNIDKETEFYITDFCVNAFSVPHDASENVGYSVRLGDDVFTLMTDIGAPTDIVKQKIRQTHHLVVESNYDEEMLRRGPYSQFLKDRIRSGTGHISNHQTAQLLLETLHPDIKHVWLCHLSEENNHPELARKTIELELRSCGIIAGVDFQFDVLKRQIPSGPYYW